MRKALLILFSAVILIGIGLFFFNRHMLQIYGTSYDPSNSRDLQKLVAIADSGRPLRDALERFRRNTGSYPTKASNLFPNYLPHTNAPDDFSLWAGWNLDEVSTNYYLLVYKVGWDDGLCYEHLTNDTHSWHYFSSTADTDLTKIIGQK